MDKRNVINIVKRYVRYLIKKGNYKVKNAFLFGSYYNNKFNKDSDIDVAIVFDRLSDNFNTLLKLMKYRRDFDTRIEPHLFDKSEFNKHNPFVIKILNNSIKII